MKKTQLRVDDLCRVIQSQGGLGPTLYVVVAVGEFGHGVVIREAGNPRSGGQVFDTSLLRKVER